MARLNKKNVVLDNNLRNRYELLSDDFRIEESNDDFYVKLSYGDRLDILARKHYGDPTLWWIIAKANNLKTMYNIDEQKVIRIPGNISKALISARKSIQETSKPTI